MCDYMKWERLLSYKRFHAPCSGKENGRTQFEKDIDRIIFSRAFRRLGSKTQVHLLTKNDHIHSRLSHSLEVASVGRSLGVKVGQYLLENKGNDLNKIKEVVGEKELQKLPLNLGDIVMAACLAHDIGNPPFGHVLEIAIQKWFQEQIKINRFNFENELKDSERLDFERFDSNAMAFRLISYKEHYENNGGMRLTFATLGAMLKYPWTSHFTKGKSKFSCFKTEYSNFYEIATELGLIIKERDDDNSKAIYARHPLAYLVEAADDICNGVLDIEDAIQLNILKVDYFKKRFIEIPNENNKIDNTKKQLLKIDDEQEDMLNNKTISWSVKNGLIRGKMIGLMIEEISKAFEQNYERIMEGSFEGDLFSKTKNSSLCKKIKRIYVNEKLQDIIYKNDRNLPLELGAYSVLKTLLDTSMEAAHEIHTGKKSSYKTDIVKKIVNRDGHTRMKEAKSYYKIIMLFLDYITGMTDDYATFVNKQLIGLGN